MDDSLAEIFLAQSNGSFVYHVTKLIMWHAATWSMRKMGRVIIHSENIWVARLFRRSAAMLTHYAVSLVLRSNWSNALLIYRQLHHTTPKITRNIQGNPNLRLG